MRALLAVLLTASAVFVPANSARAAEAEGIGIRLLEAPLDRRDDPRASSYIIDHVAPGTIIERRIEVSNGTADPAGIEVYAGGAELEDGEFRPLPEEETNELVTWSEVEPSMLEPRRPWATIAVGRGPGGALRRRVGAGLLRPRCRRSNPGQSGGYKNLPVCGPGRRAGQRLCN